MIRRLVLLAVVLPLAGAAQASEEAPKKDVGQYVDLQPMALPLQLDGRLANYVFVNLRLNLTASANTAQWRAKEPFFRDAVVRAAYRTALQPAPNNQKFADAPLTAAVLREAVAITGPGVVKSVTISAQALRGQAPPPKPGKG